MKIHVGVMGSNAGGEPDVIRFEIECTQDQYDDGAHYEMAKQLASDQGFEPAMAFDERDPAWRVMAPESDEMEVFYRNLMDVLKRTYAPGMEVDGADFISDVAQFCSDQVDCLPDDFLVGVVWCDEGFSNEFGVAVEDFTVVFDQQVIQQMTQEAGVVVAMVPPALLFEAPLPDAQDILGAAKSVLGRSDSLSGDAAIHAVRADLLEDGFVGLPASMDVILGAAVLSEVARQGQAARERGGE